MMAPNERPLRLRGAASRRTIAILIFACWLGALGWLTTRHFLRPERSAGPRWPVPPGSTFMAARLGARQVGLRTFVVDTVAEGLRAMELLTLDMPSVRAGMPRRTTLQSEALYSRGLQLVTFRQQILTETGREVRSGRVQGDTLLQFISHPDGEPPETLAVPLRRPVMLPSGVPLLVASRGIPRVGDRLNAEVFDPLNKVLRVERITVGAESLFVVPDSANFNENLKRWAVVHTDTVRAWRLDSSTDGLPESRWVDGAGMLVRIHYPLGLVIERSAFELVQTNFRALPAPTWDSAPSAPQFRTDTSTGRPQSRLLVLARLALPADSIPSGLAVLEGGWQERIGDTIRVGRPGKDTPADSAPDSKAAPLWGLFRADSTLKAVALKAAGRGSRPEVIAGDIQGWVSRNIAFKNGPGMAAPARVLATRRGNEAERVVLLAALAETAGLPARPVWGLALIGGRWQLRSWAEVWTGYWFPCDPAMGSRAGDADRIRLGTYGAGRLIDLALRASRLRLDVLETGQ
jgi:transglutaminase superfamily protein